MINGSHTPPCNHEPWLRFEMMYTIVFSQACRDGLVRWWTPPAEWQQRKAQTTGYTLSVHCRHEIRLGYSMATECSHGMRLHGSIRRSTQGLIDYPSACQMIGCQNRGRCQPSIFIVVIVLTSEQWGDRSRWRSPIRTYETSVGRERMPVRRYIRLRRANCCEASYLSTSSRHWLFIKHWCESIEVYRSIRLHSTSFNTGAFSWLNLTLNQTNHAILPIIIIVIVVYLSIITFASTLPRRCWLLNTLIFISSRVRIPMRRPANSRLTSHDKHGFVS